MAQYAVVLGGQVVDIREYAEAPECKIVDGKPTVRPYNEPAVGPYQKLGDYIIKSDSVTKAVVDMNIGEAKAEALRLMLIAKATYALPAKEVTLRNAINAAQVLDTLKQLDMTNGW